MVQISLTKSKPLLIDECFHSEPKMLLDFVDIIARKELSQKMAALELNGGAAFSTK